MAHKRDPSLELFRNNFQFFQNKIECQENLIFHALFPLLLDLQAPDEIPIDLRDEMTCVLQSLEEHLSNCNCYKLVGFITTFHSLISAVEEIKNDGYKKKDNKRKAIIQDISDILFSELKNKSSKNRDTL